MRIWSLEAARADLHAAAAFYEAAAPGLGSEFLDSVDAALALLRSNPRVGTPYEETTRRFVLPRFPFNLIYEIAGAEVTIVAIAHQRRGPGFWRDRS